MRLTERIALVGSGDGVGFGLSHPSDCHVYLIDGGDVLALVDAGVGLATDAILERVRFVGGDVNRIRYLLLTHAHADHAGGARSMHDRLGLQVIASPRTAKIVATGDADANAFTQAQRIGMYPPDAKFEPCPVDVVVREGAPLQIGDLRLTVLETPGHSADHISYLLHGEQETLFAGDSVFAGGRVVVQNVADCNITDYVRTIQRLGQLNVETFLPGHGLFVLRRGQAHLNAAKAVVDQLRFPANLAY